MNVHIIQAQMSFSNEDGYVGSVHFKVEGHEQAYEMVLQSKRGRGWGYGLFFLNGSGDEELLLQVEDEIEENDDLFETLVEAGRNAIDEDEVKAIKAKRNPNEAEADDEDDEDDEEEEEEEDDEQ